MIRAIKTLSGLPGDQSVLIKHYSSDGRGTFREGVVMQLTDDRAQTWIGNFQPAGSAGHHLFASGTAAILAGPNCYVIAGQTSQPRIISSPGSDSRWSDFRPFESSGKFYLLLVGSDGYLACIDDQGSVAGSAHLVGACEDVRVEAFDAKAVRGSFNEFNLKKRVPFEFLLRNLALKH